MLRTLLPLLIGCLLTVLPYADVQAAPVQQQSADSRQGVVNSTANIRSGPGTGYSIVGQAQAGQLLTITACNEDCSWFQLDTGNWIAAFLVELVNPPGSSDGTTSDSDPSDPDPSDSGSSNGDNSGSRRRGNLQIDPDEVDIREPSQAALEIVTQILSYTGLPQSFDVYSANIYNAAAALVNGKRVILYDPQLITDIENVTGNNWPAVSILAHEIGHHLAGHTLAEEYSKQFELEADYFSGFILNKMGATIVDAQSVMNLLRDHPNMTDHPPQAERLAAIDNGWQEADRQDGLVRNEFSAFGEELSFDMSEGFISARGSRHSMALEVGVALFLVFKE